MNAWYFGHTRFGHDLVERSMSEQANGPFITNTTQSAGLDQGIVSINIPYGFLRGILS
jgi:hypothetical protein